MSTSTQAIKKLMKRCQVGVGGRNALDEAHSIMAECYGTLGALALQRDALLDAIEAFMAMPDFDGTQRTSQIRINAKRQLDMAMNEIKVGK